MEKSNHQVKRLRSLFMPSNEVLSNPYKGFTSFNHFREDNIFTDTFGTDGWIKERYPLYDFVKEEGNKTGFYPSCDIAYIRMIWRDLEPEEGKYNFALIDEVLDKCRKNGQTLMFRVMQHTTRSFQDIPAWLAARIEHPERPDEARIKDSPTDNEYYYAFARFIRALGARYDGNPLIYGVDIPLSGAWGEGHKYQEVDTNVLHHLIDSYTQSFKTTHLFGQICSPELVHYARETRNIGWRLDGFGDYGHMLGMYPKNISKMKDVWMDSPIAFESYWYLSAWKREGWDIDYIIEQSLKWHVSSFNGKSSTIPFEWYPKIQEWLKKMGYRFAVRTIDYPAVFMQGNVNSIEMWVENRGVAPIYNRLPVRFRLKKDEEEYILDTSIDICKWMPGDTYENITLGLPKDAKKGCYNLEIKIGGFDDYPLVKLATETTHSDGWYYLGETEIG